MTRTVLDVINRNYHQAHVMYSGAPEDIFHDVFGDTQIHIVNTTAGSPFINGQGWVGENHIFDSNGNQLPASGYNVLDIASNHIDFSLVSLLSIPTGLAYYDDPSTQGISLVAHEFAHNLTYRGAKWDWYSGVEYQETVGGIRYTNPLQFRNDFSSVALASEQSVLTGCYTPQFELDADLIADWALGGGGYTQKRLATCAILHLDCEGLRNESAQ